MCYLQLSRIEVLGYALALAFFIVEVIPRIRLTNRKPFNCMMCMTGWCSLVLALFSGHGWFSGLLMIAGVFIGAVFGAVKMRWL